MAEEYNKSHDNAYEKKVGDYEEGSAAAPAETKDRGLFDFLGKKEEEKPHHPQEEVIVTEFDKVKVSEEEAPHHYESYKEEKEEEKKHESLLDKLHRSDSSSSSSSDEEEGEGEGEEKKKKNKKDKKGLKDKIQGKISGEHKEEEDTSIPVEKCHVEPDHAVHHHEVPVPVVEPTHDHDYPEEKKEEEKKGFLEKIKDKLPGQHKKSEEVPASSPPSYDHEHHAAAESAVSHDAGEAKEKKGIFEKIKEKIPGYHPKTEEEKEIKEKEKETPSY